MTKEQEITILGETNFRNQKVKFGIKTKDRRQHVYIIGKTGTGKSELLKNMAIQDIQNGKGVAVVDPHGEFAEKMLDYVPSNRINDVIYFNPADVDYPLTFNIMEKVDPEYRYLVASGLMGVFKKIWPDVWSARMEYILRNSILALLEYPGATLLGINRLLADKDYRQKVIEKITDSGVRSFWNNEFAKYPDKFREEAVAPIQNKVGQFITTPLIRNIIGQVKSSIDMRELMDNQRILIVNLSKGKIGEDASQLLGALVITKLQLAAMGRADIAEEERKDFYLYVDEFQNFATDAFATILSEARKYKLCLILAHQYVAQLETMGDKGKNTKVRDAIFGNVGTLIAFRVGADDAEFLEKEFLPAFTIDDLVNIPNYNIYIKLMINGFASRAFSALTLKIPSAQEKTHKDKAIKISRERYTIPRKIVEEKIARWNETDDEIEAKKFETTCSNCGRKTKVAFVPDGKRPVYCATCLQKEREKKSKIFTQAQVKKKMEIDLAGVREAIKKAQGKK
ncbi:MAG TPA: type IV secretion system DNA-binding domain-containing protein [Candidatus Portnoybacteria bacterium]|nr:type IV secretion system DNA-binding domain-containing protein [Candidatus Portnoybacteria bacterium]HPH52049.1 type IV secretion system DNA-binding domain-containing protein [Candidatus Portnoybacteria bacterium]HPM28440.1 type IV secretion system DNA-binding domain-containing protein [Candidatus Portnoybacteria bacterium]